MVSLNECVCASERTHEHACVRKHNSCLSRIATQIPCVDVSVISLTETTPTPLILTEGESIDFAFDIVIQNIASASSGNAIPPVTAPSTNYALLLRLSDVDLGAGALGT